MARGFHFHLSTHGPEDVTVDRVKETAHGLGQRLSAVEHELLHAAVAAAQSLVGALGHPATVTFSGVDSLSVPGDETAVSVTVSSPVTVTPDQGPVTDITESSTGEAPTVEAADSGSPADATPVETPQAPTQEAASGESVSG